MRTKVTLWAAVLALVLSLSPALGLEPLETQFGDVSPQAWYADGVTTCANEGIMIGDEAGLFRPEERLSQAECLTLALRLYAPDKEMGTAPEDWGRVQLTLADGTVLDGYGSEKSALPGLEGGHFSLYWGAYTHYESGYLCVRLDGDDAACQEWGKAHEGKATVKVGDLTISGTVNCWIPLGNWVLSFHPDTGDGSEEAMAIQNVLALDAPAPDKWYRDAYYTAHVWGLKDTEKSPGFKRLLESVSAQWYATREMFAAALGDVAEGYDLTQRVQVDGIPDETFDDGYYLKTLYEGGILNGVDEYGAFDGGSFLTRGQAAVMVARLLDEDQRLSTPLKPLPSEGYTLTETDVTWEEVYGNAAEVHDLIPTQEGELCGYVDQSGQWVILPRWESAEKFVDGYACVYQDGVWNAIDRKGNVVLGQDYTSLHNLGEGKFFGEWLDGGKGYVREVRDGQGREYPAMYGDMELEFRNGYAVYQPFGTPKGFYIDSSLRPVSGKFDRCGALDENLSGLVMLDGKTYRIQFD